MSKYWIGVDPGALGALAVLSASGDYVTSMLMPIYRRGKSSRVNAAAVAEFLRGYPGMAAIELVNAMPKQGGASMFSFGHAAGIVEGAIAAVGIGYVTVTPQVWKRHFALLGKDKDAARAVAQQLYPSAPLSRKKDCGVAEALLMARWAAETRVI